MQFKIRKRGHAQREKNLGDGSILDPVPTIRIQQKGHVFLISESILIMFHYYPSKPKDLCMVYMQYNLI